MSSVVHDRILALLIAGANADALSNADVEALLAQAEADADATVGLVGLLKALRQQRRLQQLQEQEAKLQKMRMKLKIIENTALFGFVAWVVAIFFFPDATNKN